MTGQPMDLLQNVLPVDGFVPEELGDIADPSETAPEMLAAMGTEQKEKIL